MAGQKGRDLLIQVADGAGAYVTLAGIRASRIELSAARVDATNADSPEAWRELLAGAGARSASISGSGVFKDAESDVRMREIFFASEHPDWRFFLPGLGTLTGPFQIAALSWSGRHDGEAEFSVTLESAGAVTFEAFA